MDIFIKILKRILCVIWPIFVFLVKTFLTIAGIFPRNTQKSDKGFYMEFEEKGH